MLHAFIRVLQAGGVFVAASGTISISGSIQALSPIIDPTHCGAAGVGPPVPVVEDVPCVVGAADDSAGFTLWVTAQLVLLTKSGLVQGTSMRICAYGDLAILNGGVISAAGLGCSAESGYGAGDSNLQAASSGAGHGGIGGDGASAIDPTQITLGGAAYDNVTNPRMLGSGGGDPNLGGSGGGLLWLEVAGVLFNDGVIGAPGTAGAPTTDPQSVGGGGGGSGGTLVLIVGNVSGTGVFDTSGGAGGSQVGTAV